MKVFKDAPTKIELIKAAKLLENQCECSPLVHAKIAECIKALNDEKWKQAITLAKQVGAGGKAGAAKSIAMTRTLARGLVERIKKVASTENPNLKKAKELVDDYFAQALPVYKDILRYYREVWNECKRVMESAKSLENLEPLVTKLESHFEQSNVTQILTDYFDKQNYDTEPSISRDFNRRSWWGRINDIYQRFGWAKKYLDRGNGEKAIDQFQKILRLLKEEETSHPNEYQVLKYEQVAKQLQTLIDNAAQKNRPNEYDNEDYYQQYYKLLGKKLDLKTVGAFLTDVFDKKCPDSSDLYTRKLYKELYKLSGGNETLWNTLFVPKANSLETITFA